jgi:hypothetical protein
MLGNPKLPASAKIPTRFKMWWRVVGSAVEHAAKAHTEAAVDAHGAEVKPQTISFENIFLVRETDEEDSASLADALGVMSAMWSSGFISAQVAELLNRTQGEQTTSQQKEPVVVLREFLFPEHRSKEDVSARSVGKRLSRHVHEPVKAGDVTMTLVAETDTHTKLVTFSVRTAKQTPTG